MKPLLLSTLLALPGLTLAQAGEQPAQENIQEDFLLVGEIVGVDVQTSDERKLGTLEDVLLTTSGALHEYLVDFEEPEENYNRGAVTFRDDVTDYEESPLYEGESVEGELEAELVAAPPARVRFSRNGDETVMVVDTGREGVSGLASRDAERFAQREYVRASTVMGLEIDLADEESFGSIEDIVLSANGDEVAAYIVDSWDGLDKRRHAFSKDAVQLLAAGRENAIREDYGIVKARSTYTLERVEAMPEFDRDEQ